MYNKVSQIRQRLAEWFAPKQLCEAPPLESRMKNKDLKMGVIQDI